MDPQEIVREAEAVLAAAVRGKRPHPRANLYLPTLYEMRDELKSLCTKADNAGDGELHHRFLLLLSEVDKLEEDLEGRK